MNENNFVPTKPVPEKTSWMKIGILVGLFIFSVVAIVIYLVYAYSASISQNINILPMYGGYEKNTLQLKADKDFVTKFTESMDNKTASAGIVNGAWQFFNQGDYDTAMKRFNQAWLLDSNNWDVYKGYISVYAQKKSLKDLHDYTEKLINQNPTNATLHCFSGAINNNQGLETETDSKQYWDMAETEFQKGLKLDNNNPFCQLNYASVLYHNGKYQDAWNHLVENSILPNSRYDTQLTLSIYPNIPSISSLDEYKLISGAYKNADKNDEAFILVQKAVTLYPNNAELNCDLGSLYALKWYAVRQTDPSNDLLKQSEKYLQRGIQLDLQSKFCHANYAFMLYFDNTSSLDEIWLEVEKAKSLGWIFDQQFLTDIQPVFPEPKE